MTSTTRSDRDEAAREQMTYLIAQAVDAYYVFPDEVRHPRARPALDVGRILKHTIFGIISDQLIAVPLYWNGWDAHQEAYAVGDELRTIRVDTGRGRPTNDEFDAPTTEETAA